MPRIIFKCPYLKGGSPAVMAHLKNLVGYIATRDGAEKIDPGNTRLAATNKQKELVAQLVQSFPESTELFEYEDYLSAPNRGNASAFITMVIEQNLSQLIHREKYLEYIAKRPRAQRFGTHGLFTGDRDSLVLSQVAEAVAEHPGNVWLPIISLRREDASRLGYDSAENWRSFLSSYAIQMAEAMKIPWEQFRWYAAFQYRRRRKSGRSGSCGSRRAFSGDAPRGKPPQARSKAIGGIDLAYFNAVYQSDLSHRARAVYMYLKDRSDAEGQCWPAIKTIGAELGLSRSTVKRALDDLCKAGLLQKDPRWRENGSYTSNLYRLL